MAFCSGLPQKQIKLLQALQSAAARTVMKFKKQIMSLPFLDSVTGFTVRK